MNRRSFIRSALAAMVGAAVVPRIPLPTSAPAIAPIVPRWVGTGTSAPITYTALLDSYMQAKMGAFLEPNLGVVSKSTFDYLARYEFRPLQKT